MAARSRWERIVALVDDKGFVSVTDLARACNVTAVTIRRDLQRLDEEERLRRTHGGAFSMHLQRPPDSDADRGEPSGARPRCVSPYGVYDMTGNVVDNQRAGHS